MSARIRMRMKCSQVTLSGDDQAVSLGTSTVDERKENISFSDFAAGPPNAILTIPVTQHEAKSVFADGKFYLIEITPLQT